MCQKSSNRDRSLAWLNSNPLRNIDGKKKRYGLWKQDQAMQEDYKIAVRHSRERI